MKIDNLAPQEIEKASFAIISKELADRALNNFLNSETESVVKRCIHTSADFDYAENLYFTEGVVALIKNALSNGADIITDTQMVKAGINKPLLAKLGSSVHCFIAEDRIREEAERRGLSRSYVSMEECQNFEKPYVVAVGNAPTALFSLAKQIKEAKIKPVAIIAVPVGFVNVVESKKIIMDIKIPSIVARGRKGGSNIAAAIVNACLYQLKEL